MKKTITSLMALVAIVLMTASCSKGNDIAKAIPANAQVVLKANVATLSEKAALKENKQLQTDLQEGIKGLSEGLQKKVKAIMDNPAESGFALQKPLFVGVTDADKMQFVVAVGVDDKDKVDELFKSMQQDSKSTKITAGEEETLVEDEDLQIAYNSDLCVFTIGTKNAKELLVQDEGKSILSQDKFAKVIEGTSDIDAYIDYASLMGTAQKMSRKPELAAASELVKGLYLIANVNFEEKEAVIKTEAFGNEVMLGLSKAIQNKPSGDYLKLAPADAYAVLQCGVKNMEKIKELLPKAETEQIDKQLQSMGISLDQMLKAIEGDILLSVAPNGTQQMPQISFVLACKDQKVWEAISKAAAPMGESMVEKKDDNTYNLKLQAVAGMDYTLSYDKKAIVMTPVTAPAKTFKDNDNASAVKDGGFFIDIQKILGNPQVKGMAGQQATALADLESISATGEGNKGEYKITFNKPGNALATLIKMAQK